MLLLLWGGGRNVFTVPTDAQHANVGRHFNTLRSRPIRMMTFLPVHNFFDRYLSLPTSIETSPDVFVRKGNQAQYLFSKHNP